MLRSERTYWNLSARYTRRALQAKKRRDDRAGTYYGRLARHYRRMAERVAVHERGR